VVDVKKEDGKKTGKGKTSFPDAGEEKNLMLIG